MQRGADSIIAMTWKKFRIFAVIATLTIAVYIIQGCFSDNQKYGELKSLTAEVSKTGPDTDFELEESKVQIVSSVDYGNCTRRKHVAMVKTHKCASDLLSTILLRFADENNLAVFLPVKPSSNIGFPFLFNPKKIRHRPSTKRSGKYDMMALHTTYDESIWHHLMEDDAIYIGLVREPLRQFESYFNYYHLPDTLHRHFGYIEPEDAIDEFLKDAELFMGKWYSRWESKFIYRKFLQNTMLADFGLHAHPQFSPSDYISLLLKNFDLIIPSEHLDEGLVLLRRHLCWDMQDFFYLPKNVAGSGWRPQYSFNISDPKVEETRRKLHRQFSSADYELHERSTKIFWNKISKLAHFSEELETFKDNNRKVEDFCRQWKRDSGIQTLKLPPSKFNEEIKIDRDFCVRISNDLMPAIRSLYRKRPSTLH